MDASFEEKSVWITLLGLVVTFGFYFSVAGQMMAEGITTVMAYAPVFTATVALLVAILIAAHIAVAIASRPDGRDERDRVIGWRAENNSSWLAASGIFLAIVALAFPIERVWIANGLLLSLFFAEVAKRSLQIYYYRQGM
jgi:hypothetical protein